MTERTLPLRLRAILRDASLGDTCPRRSGGTACGSADGGDGKLSLQKPFSFLSL